MGKRRQETKGNEMINTCKTCGKEFISSSKKSVCPACIGNKESNYAEEQKQKTLEMAGKIDTETIKKIAEEAREEVNLKLERPVTEKPRKSEYPFLQDIAELITKCKGMPVDPWKVSELCCQALENNIINLYQESEKTEEVK